MRVPDDAVVRCDGLHVRYRTATGAAPALVDVHASFPRRRLSVLAGPSGSGKSTFLRAVAGLVAIDAGSLWVDGADVTRLRPGARRRLRRHAMGLVLQRPADNLLEHLTATEQVAVAARLRGAPPAGAASALAQVGVAHRAGTWPEQLSGGEQQRVAFAAAIVGAPTIVLADEPTAQLDAAAGAAVVATMRALADDGATLLVASHDRAVIEAADHVVELHDGRVVP